MIKKIFTSFMILSMFSFNAHATGENTLKAIFEDLKYSLNVEWDQKDKAFYDAQMSKFSSEVKKLQAQGLSNQELIDFAKGQVKNAQVASNIEAVLNLIQINKMKPEEARKFVLDTMAKSYTKGANYSDAGVAIVAAVLVIALVAVIIAAAANGPVYNGGYGCSETYVCDDYYDSWGYYLYSDCYYTTYCY